MLSNQRSVLILDAQHKPRMLLCYAFLHFPPRPWHSLAGTQSTGARLIYDRNDHKAYEIAVVLLVCLSFSRPHVPTSQYGVP